MARQAEIDTPKQDNPNGRLSRGEAKHRRVQSHRRDLSRGLSRLADLNPRRDPNRRRTDDAER